MATENGTAVVFTFKSAVGVTVTELTGNLTQSIRHAKKTERRLVKDGNGNRVSSLHTDFMESLQLRYVVSGSTLSAAITNGSCPAIGSFIHITACTQYPDIKTTAPGRIYEVIDASAELGNESNLEITLDVEYAAGIQAVAT